SGMSCKACRNEAEASANSRSCLMRAPLLRLLSCSSGVGVLDDSSGEMCAAFFSFGLVGRPSDSMMPENRFSVCTPKASRIEPATILSLLLSMVENATSMTKKLIIRPMRSAKVTNQPCPPPCASPRFFLAIVDLPPRSPQRLRGYLFAFRVAVLFRQIGQKHFADQRRALGIPDHEDAVDDQGAVGFLVEQLAVQLVGKRQTEQVRNQRAVK